MYVHTRQFSRRFSYKRSLFFRKEACCSPADCLALEKFLKRKEEQKHIFKRCFFAVHLVLLLEKDDSVYGGFCGKRVQSFQLSCPHHHFQFRKLKRPQCAATHKSDRKGAEKRRGGSTVYTKGKQGSIAFLLSGGRAWKPLHCRARGRETSCIIISASSHLLCTLQCTYFKKHPLLSHLSFLHVSTTFLFQKQNGVW